MAQYDGSIRINTDIIIKNIKPKIQELEKSLYEVGEKAEKARIKLENLDKAKVSYRSEEYKKAQAELESFVNTYKDIVYQIADYGNQVNDALAFDFSKVDEARKKLNMLDISGVSHEDKEYKETERNLNHLIYAQERYQEVTSQFDASTENALEGMKNLISETDKYLSNSEKEIIDFDEHWNQLRGDVEEYANSLKELQDQGKYFGDEDYDKVYIAWKNAKDAVKEYQTELNKQTASGQAKIAEQEAKSAERKEAAQRKAEEQAEKALQKENERIQKQAENEAKLQAKEAERQEKIRAEAAEEERLNKIRVNAVATNDEIIAKVERIKQLEQEIADLKKVERTEGYEDYDNRIAELSKLKQDVKEYSNSLSEVPERFFQMHSVAQKAFDALSSGLSKVGSIGKKAFSGIISMAKKAFSAITSGSKQSNASLSGGLKTILKYGLGIRSLYTLFSKIRSGIQEGFKNLMDYSGDFANSIQSVKNSMSTLGNQIAAAFVPIVQMVIPWLNQLISALSTAMSYVAQFIAALTGKGTFTKAKQVQDSYNKSLGGTAVAAKKAYGALAKFDDLDVLQKQEDDTGAAGAMGDLFEEVPISDKFKDLVQWLKDMWENSDFYELGKLLGEKLKEALDNIPWDKIKETARKIGKSIASLINGFIEVEALGYSIGRTLAEVFNTAFEFLNAFVHELHWESIGHFIADTLNGVFENIDWELIRDTFVVGFKGLADAINQFIKDFHWENVSNTISNAINTITETVYIFFSTVKWDKLGKKLGNQLMETIKKIDWKQLGMAIGSVVQSALDFLKSFISELDFTEIANALIETLKGFFEVVDAGDLATAILTIISASLAAKAVSFGFQTVSSAILHSLGTAILTGLSELGTILSAAASTIAGALSSVILPVLAVVAAAVAGWHIGSWIAEKLELDPQPFNETMQGIKDSFTDGSWKEALQLWGDDIYNAFVTLGERQAEWWESMKTTFEGIITFLTGVFTSGWQKAWDGIVKIFDGVKNTIKGIINGILGFVESLANGVINAINAVIRALNALSFDVPDWIPGIGGETFGFELSEIPNISIPKLANGAVIRGGNPFMAILGDQRVGQTNVEAPLDTIKQAVREELSSMDFGGSHGNINPIISLNVNGEEFARLTLNDIFQEAARQGYDVSILGVV